MKVIHILRHLLLGLVIVAGFSVVVMLLWNWLAPAIFGLTVINFWQALGLLALTRILFGGIRNKHWMGKAHHHHNPIREKWMRMTDDERRKFVKNHHFDYCGCGHDFLRENKSEKQE
jgi:hypothetical protein